VPNIFTPMQTVAMMFSAYKYELDITSICMLTNTLDARCL
jgi:hypothetical protein